MRLALKIPLYLAACVWVMARYLAAFPVVMLALGASVVGDDEAEARLSRLVDRIVGDLGA